MSADVKQPIEDEKPMPKIETAKVNQQKDESGSGRIALSVFIANSPYIRKYSTYLRDTFKRWVAVNGKDANMLRTEREWETLFDEYANYKAE